MTDKRTESQPLVHDGVMFLNQSSSIVQALDAKTGELFWSYERELPPKLPTLAYGNRNIAILGTTVFTGTSDAWLVALDARTGKPKWERKVGDHEINQHYSAGPIIADGLVVIGMSGCYHYTPGGCWISAHDLEAGNEIWRRNTLARPDEPGGDTWGKTPADERYGGSVWIPPTYDPQRNVIYVASTVPLPWGRSQRGHDGDALYSNSTLALDPKTGKILWYLLWRTRLAVPPQGFPVSYEVDGKQYIAVPSGVGMAIPQLVPEIRSPNSGSVLYVFALPD